ncbi:dTDP-4-dehydrorhamnose reductase [Ralstonia sp. UNC404CL21Col]|uniref:dTDP-4-dehydrorhamnose reductase n=1 Tax=Ralstonia sp. UNC404CL21Col TaxID=1380362 RepID=UPI0004881882|nr:dTDP-4-dehydrorhamnose reductase [Ralstonia sp. UNC404CL21Col]
MLYSRAESPTFLVTGCSGQLGFELCRSLAPLGRVIAPDRRECDFRNPETIRRTVRTHRPSVIVNAAAYTAVDRAESEVDMVFAVNAKAPQVLAEEVATLGGLLVHYSTDYVFDGGKPSAYVETDVARPLSVYGSSKLAGERAIAEAGTAALILRTSWMAGAHGENFAKTILALAHEREFLEVVADQYGAPTTASLVADVTAQIIARHWLFGNRTEFPFGLYHLCASGEATWHSYAVEVLHYAKSRGCVLRAEPISVSAIPVAARPSLARRPSNSRLDTRKLRETFGIHLPDWREGVRHLLDQVLS